MNRRPGFVVRASRWLLERALPDEYREVILGDLEEHRASGKSDAWYARQAISALHPLRLLQLRRRTDSVTVTTPTNGATLVHQTFQDLRLGMRLMLRSPGPTVCAVLALAMGIGLTTTMFSITYGVLYRGLPFERSSQIIHIQRINPVTGEGQASASIHDYADWRARQKSFVDLAAFTSSTVTVSGSPGERPGLLSGAHITANAFAMLPVRPALGRLFSDSEERPGAEKVAILSHGTWQTRYGGDSTIAGTIVRVNGVPTTIVGVMPPRFAFPARQQIWMPLVVDPLATPRGTQVEGQWLETFGRLRDGVTLREAQTEFTGITAQLAREHPATNENVSVSLGGFGRRYIGEQAASLLQTMLAAVFLVLLVACTNVASLLIGRAITRSREVSVRTALGATRRRIVTQFLGESLVLALTGAVLGLVIALLGVRAFNSVVNMERIPYWVSINVDGVAILFVLGIAVLSALLAGTLPALQAAKARVADVLNDGSRGASSFRLGRVSRTLVVLEFGLSCGLLVAAGLTIKSVAKLRNVDLGFDAAPLFTAMIELPADRYGDAERQIAFHDDLAGRVRAIPGVQSATLSSAVPGLGAERERFMLDGATYQREQDYPSALRVSVAQEFFPTLGVTPVAGRDFNSGEVPGALSVAIVNTPFVSRYFPTLARTDEAVGRRIRVDNGTPNARWLTVVGVVPDVSAGELSVSQLRAPTFYVPLSQWSERVVVVIARAIGPPLELTGPVRDAVAAIDRDLAFGEPATLRSAVERDTWFIPLFGGMFLMFGVAALVMAVVGLYAVTAFAVSQRTRELGIRMALGARAADVLRMVLRQSLIHVSMGTAVGLAMAAALAQLLAVIMFDVEPRDPAVYGGVIAVLAATALAACVVPAWRATRVHPADALRRD